MFQFDYREMVRSICEATDLENWEEIAEDGHLVIDGTLVRLVHAAGSDSNHLSLYFDMGEVPDLAAVATGMLVHNATASAQVGRFGVLLDEERVVYQVDHPWNEPISGVNLAIELAAHVRTAHESFARCAQV